MKQIMEPKKIKEDNFYADTQKVDVSTGSSSVQFDLGFEPQYYLVGLSYFSLCYGSSDHHVKELGISINPETGVSATQKSFQITATLKDGSGHSLSGSLNYVGVSLVAFSDFEGLDQKLYSLQKFHAAYTDGKDHHMNGYGVTLGQDDTASGGTISGHTYMEDGSGHRSVEQAGFESVPVSSEILTRLEEGGIYFISGFELSKLDGDNHVYRTGASLLTGDYCGISDKHENYADVREVRVNQTSTTPFLDLICTLKREGEHHIVNAKTGVDDLVTSHFQGMVCSDNIAVISHNYDWKSKGKLVAVPLTGSTAKQFNIDTYDDGFNHPGGMQRCGNYVAVPIENSDHDKSHVRMYDISLLGSGAADTDQIKYLSQFDLYRSDETVEDGGAAAAGMCKMPEQQGGVYLLAVYNPRNSGLTDFYKAVVTEEECGVETLLSLQTGCNDYQNIGLFTDTSGIYMVGFRCPESGISYADYLDIYQIDLDAPSIRKVMVRHMETNSTGILGIAGVHFRWAACIEWDEEKDLKLYATRRNAPANEVQYNVFTQSGE